MNKPTGPQIVSLTNILEIVEESTSPDYSFTKLSPGYYPFMVSNDGKVTINDKLTQWDFGLYLVENNSTENKINSKSKTEWITAKGLYDFGCHTVALNLTHASAFLRDDLDESGQGTGVIDHKYNSVYEIVADDDYILPVGSSVVHSRALENILYAPYDSNHKALLTFTLPTQNCFISIDAIQWTFNIVSAISGGSFVGTPANKISRDQVVNIEFQASEGHSLPQSVSVQGAEYSYTTEGNKGKIALSNPYTAVTVDVVCGGSAGAGADHEL